MQHVTIYREPSRFAGWPANYGIWAWDNEIVVGFTLGHMNPDGGFHARDKSRAFVPMQARSLDGGEQWTVTSTPCNTPAGRGLSADEHMNTELQIDPILGREIVIPAADGDIDFTHPDFALMCARSGLNAGAVSWFYTTNDRCRTWQGPYALPDFGQTGIAARTDYLVEGPRQCKLFLTAAKSNGREGKVFSAETIDGGLNFELVSYIGPEPAGFSIMPASVRLADGAILVAIRRKAAGSAFTADRAFIDLYRSDDDARSWRYLGEPVAATGSGGNPPTLTLLADGRLCIVYGYRAEPYGMRARFSEDNGVSWSDDTILRADGGNHDIGYPRTVQRPDGQLVTVYYYNDAADGERYLAATIWQPE